MWTTTVVAFQSLCFLFMMIFLSMMFMVSAIEYQGEQSQESSSVLNAELWPEYVVAMDHQSSSLTSMSWNHPPLLHHQQQQPPPPHRLRSSSSQKNIELDSTVRTTSSSMMTINNNNNDQGSTNSSFVFLQKFSLKGTPFFHTEVLVCQRDQFSIQDQDVLDQQISTLVDFIEIEESWWTTRSNVICVELGYGGSSCTASCCSSPHTEKQLNFPLNARQAVISNADTSSKTLFLYGSSKLTGEETYQRICGRRHEQQQEEGQHDNRNNNDGSNGSNDDYDDYDDEKKAIDGKEKKDEDDDDDDDSMNNNDTNKCWSNWSGIDYNPITNNCNTFTSAILACVLGLSEKKPNLGPSDMITVTCDKCPQPQQQQDEGVDNTWMSLSFMKGEEEVVSMIM